MKGCFCDSAFELDSGLKLMRDLGTSESEIHTEVIYVVVLLRFNCNVENSRSFVVFLSWKKSELVCSNLV